MINDMLALEHEVKDLEAELAYAYKRNKCERDGLVIEYELVLNEVRKRLERLDNVYRDENASINDLCNAVEYVLELRKML